MGLRGSIVAALAMLAVSFHQARAQDAPVGVPCDMDCRMGLDSVLPGATGAGPDGVAATGLGRHARRASARAERRRRAAAARKRDTFGGEHAARTGEAPATLAPAPAPAGLVPPPVRLPAPNDVMASTGQAAAAPSSLPVLTAFAPEMGVGPVFTSALPQATREAMSAGDGPATTEGERILPEPQPWVGRTVSLPAP